MKISAREMSFIGLFVALTAVGAFIPGIPIGPVPITLQTLFTALAGVILGARLGAWSQLIYVLLGLIGLPIFSGFTGGLSKVMSPSFGYLIGFIVSAYITGKLCTRTNNIKFFNLFIYIFIGYIFIYIIGIPYMYIILTKVMGTSITFYGAFKMGCLVFLPGDIIKAIVTALLGVKILPLIKDKINTQKEGLKV